MVDEEEAKPLEIEGIKKLSEEELGRLVKDAGIENLPLVGFLDGAQHSVVFAHVDFTTIADLRFSDFVFPTGTSFDGAHFGNGVHFERARFGFGARFVGARFGIWANFDYARFGFGADFEGAHFGSGARFVGARFGKEAGFDGARFGFGADFDDAHFGNGAHFDGTRFGDNVCFDGAIFSEETRFHGASFKGHAYFRAPNTVARVDTNDGIRRGVASTEALVEERLMETVGDTFSRIFFNGAHFEGVADFSGRSFKGPVSFRNATFHQVPELADVEGAGRIDPSGITINFSGVLQLPIVGKHLRISHWTTNSWVPTRLRRLRKIIEDTRAHDIERDLFILERKADRGVLWALGGLRNRMRSLVWILLLAIYGAVSDFGRSMVRPIASIAIAWYGFRWLYGWLGIGSIMGPLTSDQMDGLARDLTSFTTGNMLPFVSGLSPARSEMLKRLFGAGIEIPSVVEWASIAQNALGALLLFLLLLAVRNRFRVG